MWRSAEPNELTISVTLAGPAKLSSSIDMIAARPVQSAMAPAMERHEPAAIVRLALAPWSTSRAASTWSVHFSPG